MWNWYDFQYKYHRSFYETFKAGTHHTRWVEDDLDADLWGEDVAEAIPTQTSGQTQEYLVPVEVNGKLFNVKMHLPEATGSSNSKKTSPRKKASSSSSPQTQSGAITAPMQGTIVAVSKSIGDDVTKGETICVLEAMKMENQIKASSDGTIKDLMVNPGDLVGAGDTLAIIE